jgi:UDP-GlcNAc:undecaprenyl-phosphate GlcNAc-1-phosphate transferase
MDVALPVVTGATALVASLALTPMVRRAAIARGWVCQPRADRWSSRTVALMGGVAIVAATSLSLLVSGVGTTGPARSVFLSSLFMFLVGAIDDRISVRPHLKLLAQVLAAVAVVESGLRFGFPGHGGAVFDHLLTIFWLVGIGNAFNLLDNMDGLCAGVATVAGGCLVLVGVAVGDQEAAAMSAALAGACLGYLRYNRAPASIFMGDCGSLFIGHWLACAALLPKRTGLAEGGIVGAMVVPVMIMLIPLMDTTLVTLSRKWFRRPISTGGRDHSSHRLVAVGLSETGAVGLLCALGALGGLSALALLFTDWYWTTALLPLVMLTVALLGWYLLRVRVYHETATLADLLNQTPIPLLAQHRYRRRMGEVLFDTAAIAFGLYVAFVLRFEGAMARSEVLDVFRGAMPLVVAAHLVAYFAAGVYRGMWRYTSARDIPRFALGALGGAVLSAALLTAFRRGDGFARAIYVINAMCQFLLLAGTRVSLRLMRDWFRERSTDARPALVVGLAEHAEPTLRRLLLSNGWGVQPLGAITESRQLVGLELLGVPVLGTSSEIGDVLEGIDVSEVLLIDEHYPQDAWDTIRRAAGAAGIAARVVRSVIEADDYPTGG